MYKTIEWMSIKGKGQVNLAAVSSTFSSTNTDCYNQLMQVSDMFLNC